MHTGVAAVVFMSDNSKQGHVQPDAKEGASSKEARACVDDRERAVMMCDMDLSKCVHNLVAKCFP